MKRKLKKRLDLKRFVFGLFGKTERKIDVKNLGVECLVFSGLLFTCKPLSKQSDDRWVFLQDARLKDLPGKMFS